MILVTAAHLEEAMVKKPNNRKETESNMTRFNDERKSTEIASAHLHILLREISKAWCSSFEKEMGQFDHTFHRTRSITGKK